MEKEKEDLAVKWNNIFKKLKAVRDEWGVLQEDLNGLSLTDLEQEYSAEAQRFLTKFRNVRFDWVVPMWVDYWRGRGGLDEMLIPREEKEAEMIEKMDGKMEEDLAKMRKENN